MPTSAPTKASAPKEPDPRSGSGALDRYFRITERGSSVGREVRGGVVTFFTMAYIIVLNPLILGFATDADGQFLGGGSEPNLPAIAAGTAQQVAVGILDEPEDQRVEHDDVGHREEGDDAATDLAGDGRAALGDLEEGIHGRYRTTCGSLPCFAAPHVGRLGWPRA